MDQERIAAAAAASVAAEAQEGAPVPSAAPTDNAAPGTQDAPAFDWDSDENPYKAKVSEYETKAQKAERLERENEIFRQQFAQAAKIAEKNRRAQIQSDFDDGRIDSAEFKKRMEAELDQRDQYWQQQMTPYLTRDWADQVSQHYGLTQEERQELNSVEGPAMEAVAQQIVKRRQLAPASEVQSLRSELDQLRRSLAAKQVADSGVTNTLGGNPSGAGTTPPPGSVQKLRGILQQTHPEMYQQRRG